eukprot:11030142-Lingulodinium_polyedra.AAC.1
MPEPPAPPAAADAVLGRDSPVGAMRGRLKTLKRNGIYDAAVWGTKAQLWERLVRCEAQWQHKQAVAAELEERQRRIREGEVPEAPATLP